MCHHHDSVEQPDDLAAALDERDDLRQRAGQLRFHSGRDFGDGAGGLLHGIEDGHRVKIELEPQHHQDEKRRRPPEA